MAHAALRLRGFRTRYVRTRVGRVHLLEARGHGPLPTLVLLHGLSAAGFHYYPLLRALRPRVRHLVAMDMPGHGLSDVPATGLTQATLRAGLYGAFESVLRAHESVVLFGNSLGGLAALRYALEKPERVRALVLFAPGGAAMTDAEVEDLQRTFHLRTHGQALAFVDRLFARPSRLRHLYAWGVRRTFAPSHIRGFVADLKPAQFLREEELAALRVPTLLLWGQHERILPMSNFEFFERALPGHARVELYRGVGHTPFLERPGEVARRILSFVEEVEAARRHRHQAAAPHA